MHKILKQLLMIIIIPTIVWGTTLFLLCNYWGYVIQKVSEISSTEIIFPFWVALLVLLIVYICAMVIIYVLVEREEILEEYGIDF
jgi:hypothetical protein